ncbi:MAG: signal recognition particle receptor subunit alpha, partial [Pseudomonadota bacterium]
MAFFKKLKDRLFKSSSKLDEGLEAIVDDGGVEESAAPQTTAPPTPDAPQRAPDVPAVPEAAADVPPAPTPTAENPPGPDAAQLSEAARSHPPSPAPAVDDTAPDDVEDEPSNSAVQQAATPEPVPTPTAIDPPAPAPAQPAPSRGILGRLIGRKDTAPVLRRTLDDDMLEQLEELLIAADMGVDTALRVTANMAEGRMGRKLSVTEIKELMASEIARIMEPVARPLPIYPTTPQVVLVVGVNGSGKTTTIGKLASQFQAAGKSVVIAAGDTFRAAAVEQLQVWGERAGVPVLTAPEGS